MMGCAIVFLLAGLATGTAPVFVLGLVFMLIHLDRMNHRPQAGGGDRADGPWDGDIDDDHAV